ncbi:hypothetical protein B0H11DRAFT_1919017 [Mycena galericulata]|nr:hypothetical protein B0H11DRAFT_1932366 [Mycena galericulata]KAJ7473156.1 hypothetical protein B0H11DRAFT_1919017 [Mycena galericulata]
MVMGTVSGHVTSKAQTFGPTRAVDTCLASRRIQLAGITTSVGDIDQARATCQQAVFIIEVANFGDTVLRATNGVQLVVGTACHSRIGILVLVGHIASIAAPQRGYITQDRAEEISVESTCFGRVELRAAAALKAARWNGRERPVQARKIAGVTTSDICVAGHDRTEEIIIKTVLRTATSSKGLGSNGAGTDNRGTSDDKVIISMDTMPGFRLVSFHLEPHSVHRRLLSGMGAVDQEYSSPTHVLTSPDTPHVAPLSRSQLPLAAFPIPRLILDSFPLDTNCLGYAEARRRVHLFLAI